MTDERDRPPPGAPPPGTLPGAGGAQPQPPAPAYHQIPFQPPVAYRPPPQPSPYAPPPQAYAPPMTPSLAMRRTHLASAVRPPTGTGFLAMAILSLRRALRLRIDANEVLPDERVAMMAAQPAIADETQQAFLAWRRSVLFVAALLMIPVAILHAVEHAREKPMTETWHQLGDVNMLIEICFGAFLWTQVGTWRSWRTQSRRLAIAWIVYFVAPFLVFLYPLAKSFNYDQLGGIGDEAMAQAHFAVGMAVGAQAFLSLAPKIISLLQGLIRASIATKTLLPGASAPGWMMVIAAPLYMIVFYVFVLLPYHFTGSELVLVGMLCVLAAKSTLVRAGLRLARPMTDEVARATTHKAQTIWMALLVTGIAFIVGGLWDLVKLASPLSLVNFALSMASNILLLTLISTDALITGIDRAANLSPEERALADEAHADVAAFTALRK